ncbi:MAG: glycosyltransferase [Nanoarchaeota archaeon]|nr:glycosyltransferase [Nanoarchaeota archaeon]
MKFSIIIPACNEEKYIEKTLKSLPKDQEIIVVCNGCDDKTKKIAKKYSKIISIKQKNVSKARNLGAKKSKYQNLIFLDADTLFKKNTLKEIGIALKKYDFGICKFEPDIKKTKYLVMKFFRDVFEITNHPFIVNMIYGSGVIYCKKSIFKKVNGFDERHRIGEDREFLMKAKKYGKYSIAKARVITSMRRFEKVSMFKRALTSVLSFLFNRKSKYPIVR